MIRFLCTWLTSIFCWFIFWEIQTNFLNSNSLTDNSLLLLGSIGAMGLPALVLSLFDIKADGKLDTLAVSASFFGIVPGTIVWTVIVGYP